jgi:hypothetical protein
MQLNEITWQTMEPYVGQTFRIDFAGGQHVDLKLTDVKKVIDVHVDPRLTRDTFSLYFVGPAEAFLPQATYPLLHETLDEPLHIFIVPVGKVAEGFRYEAVFT